MIMDDIQVLPYRPEMLAGCLAVWNEVIADGGAFVYDAPFTEPAFADMLAEQTAVHCALCGGAVAGLYLLHPNWPGRGAHVVNASYAVGRRFRGWGLGRMLGEHSLEAARQLGFAAMQYNAVVGTNAAALALWRSLGFEEIGQAPNAFDLGDGHYAPLVLMYRRL